MKKVLVVENDRNIALTLEIRLRELGVKPILAYDAVMGVSAVSSHEPDVIIMDIIDACR
ncbi:MAG: DNA-binding response OmpR family regulator [Enterobacterales bacterium]|jgi:DNA-binding response OmpR family regulator